MAETFQDAILTVAYAYREAVAQHGGRSLSRVATIVVNRGTFFERLTGDASFSVKNLERFADWFRQEGNWPMGIVPAKAADALMSMGRPVACPEKGATA